MNLEDVREKYKRKNQVLFDRDSACLQELLRLIRQQKHRTLVMWAFECAEPVVDRLRERYPKDHRPEEALHLCKLWAGGEIKMPEAKRALLQAHAMAKEIDNPADIALCHGVGQACAAVHVETHAIGLVLYELTAIVREVGIDHCETAVAEKIDDYISCLRFWQQEIDREPRQWAAFLLDDSRPNKEQILHEKYRFFCTPG